MLIKRTDDIPASEITPESVYFDRRRFLEVAAAGAGAFLASSTIPGLLNAGGGALARKEKVTAETTSSHLTS